MNILKRIVKGLNTIQTNELSEERKQELHRTVSSIKYWTPELIEWIAGENDAIVLSVASCLVNSRQWPEWLPSKPEGYVNDALYDGEILWFAVNVCKILEKKAETICPELYGKIWLSHYYKNFDCDKHKMKVFL